MKKRMKGILAMIAAGILAVAAIPISACGEEAEFIEEEFFNVIELLFWGDNNISSTPYQISFVFPRDYEYECTTVNGYLYDAENQSTLQKQVVCASDETIYWRPTESGYIKEPQTGKDDVKTDCIDIIIKENEQIAGYAVIKIRATQRGNYYAYLLKSVCFFPYDVEITEQQVQKLIEKAKKL